MTKDVLISIKGLQFDTSAAESRDELELIVAGQYYKKGETQYLMYEEALGGGGKDTKNTIKITKDRVEVNKKGTVNASMLFIEGQKNISTYRTPFGNMVVGIDTDAIKIDQDEDHMALDILYYLDFNYDLFAECNLKIEARSKETGNAFFTST